jgi:flagellar hook assembly protein FlgD
MTIPVTINRDVEVNAITLSFNYRNDLIEVLGTNYADDDMFINQEEGILNVAWFDLTTLDMAAEANIAQIRVRVLAEIPANTELFELNVNTELADVNAQSIENVTLKTIGITTDKGIINGTDLVIGNYPNPFTNSTTISYTLPENGKVKVEVYNNMGVLVTTLIEETQESGVQNITFDSDVLPGVYFYHVTLQGETNNYSAVKRMIVVN